MPELWFNATGCNSNGNGWILLIKTKQKGKKYKISSNNLIQNKTGNFFIKKN